MKRNDIQKLSKWVKLLNITEVFLFFPLHFFHYMCIPKGITLGSANGWQWFKIHLFMLGLGSSSQLVSCWDHIFPWSFGCDTVFTKQSKVIYVKCNMYKGKVMCSLSWLCKSSKGGHWVLSDWVSLSTDRRGDRHHRSPDRPVGRMERGYPLCGIAVEFLLINSTL